MTSNRDSTLRTENSLGLFYLNKKQAKKDFNYLIKQFDNSVLPSHVVKSQSVNTKNYIKKLWVRFLDQGNNCFQAHSFSISLDNRKKKPYKCEISIIYN